MVRLNAKRVMITSGRAMFIDALCHLAETDTVEHDGLACFGHPYISRDGAYKVYTNGFIHVVDVCPRLFRAKTRPTFTKLELTIPVDACSIGIVDLNPAILNIYPFLNEYEANHPVIGVEPGEYAFWFEEKEDNPYRGLIGFGAAHTLLLHGEFGDAVYELEKDVAKYLRSKGKDRGARRQPLVERAIALHDRGCRDRRLHGLARLLKAELPRTRKA